MSLIDKLRENLNKAKQQYYGQFDSAYDERYAELSNPDSEYYQSFYKNISKILNESSPNIDSLLGLSMAMGGDYGSSMAMANEQRKSLEVKNREAAGSATENFFLNSQGQANNLLNNKVNSKLSLMQLGEQRRQYDESQPTFWEGLLNIGSGLLGDKLGKMKWG